jgi:hypothetical protein
MGTAAIAFHAGFAHTVSFVRRCHLATPCPLPSSSHHQYCHLERLGRTTVISATILAPVVTCGLYHGTLQIPMRLIRIRPRCRAKTTIVSQGAVTTGFTPERSTAVSAG